MVRDSICSVYWQSKAFQTSKFSSDCLVSGLSPRPVAVLALTHTRLVYAPRWQKSELRSRRCMFSTGGVGGRFTAGSIKPQERVELSDTDGSVSNSITHSSQL